MNTEYKKGYFVFCIIDLIKKMLYGICNVKDGKHKPTPDHIY